MIFLSVVFFSLVLLFALWVGKWRITSPVGYFAYLLLIMYFAKFLICSIAGLDFLEGYKPSDFTLAYAVLALYLLIALLTRAAMGSVVNNIIQRNVRQPTNSFRDGFYVRPVALLLAGVVPLSIILIIKLMFGYWSFQAPGEFRSVLQGGGNAYFFILANFFSFVLCVHVSDRILIERRLPSLVAIISFPIVLFYAITCGFTSMIIALVTYIVYYWQVITRKRFEWILIPLFPVAVVYGAVHLQFKNSARSDNLERANFIEITDNFLKDKDAQKSVLNRLDYIEMYNLGLNSLLNDKPDLGLNMISLVIQPLPRRFWAEKPLTFSGEMTKKFLPANFYSGVTANFGGVNEFINAFGFIGIIVGGIYLGVVFAVAEVFYARAVISRQSAGFYIIVVMPYVGGCLTGAINDFPVPLMICSYLLFKFFCTPKTKPKFDNNPSRMLGRNAKYPMG